MSDVDEPPEAEGSVLVETLAVGVCGTDREIAADHVKFDGGREARLFRSPHRYIEEPDPSGGAPHAVILEGFAKGAATFNRLEGCRDGSGSIFFASTSGADVKDGDVDSDGVEEGYGQIREYVPRGRSGGRQRRRPADGEQAYACVTGSSWDSGRVPG